MKKLIVLSLSLVLFLGGLTAQEKAVKLGHINSQEILQIMPQRAAAEKEMEALRVRLTNTLTEMSKEYETKMVQFQNLDNTTPSSEVESLKSEILSLEGRIQEYQAGAEQDLAKKQEELLQPMLKSVQDAINAVGDENGFTYIFDISTGSVLYKSGQDVGDLVKKKLGL